MLLGRVFSYPDTHRYRIGTNYLQLLVNQPHVPVHSYNKDGSMRYSNPPDPVYATNSYGGPEADPNAELPGWLVEAGEIGRYVWTAHRNDNDFVQPGTLYRKVLDDAARERMASNIAGHVWQGVVDPVLSRTLAYWSNVDTGLGARVAAMLGLNPVGQGRPSSVTG